MSLSADSGYRTRCCGTSGTRSIKNHNWGRCNVIRSRFNRCSRKIHGFIQTNRYQCGRFVLSRHHGGALCQGATRRQCCDPQRGFPSRNNVGIDAVFDDLMHRLDMATRSEVESVYARAQMGAVRFKAVDGKHAHSTLAILPRYARQIPYIPTSTCEQSQKCCICERF